MGETEKIRIAYSGEALENGSMDVKDLAPALLAFANLVERANTVIGNERSVKLLLKADDIKVGSFDVILELVSSSADQVKALVGLVNDTGLKDLVDVLGLGKNISDGIFWLIGAVGGRKIVKALQNKPGGDITINFNDSTSIQVNQNTYNVFLDHESREQVTRIVSPVGKNGIDSFEIRDPHNMSSKEPSFRVVKDDLSKYDAPEPEMIKNSHNVFEQVMYVTIISLVFDRHQKWKFYDGESKFWALVEDEAFLNKVENHEYLFGAGDKLKVRCKIEQSFFTDGKLTNEKTIVEVLEVIPKPTQIRLNFED